MLLSIPVLIFILVYNYRQNAAAINATLNDVVAKTKQASIENAESMIHGVAATARVLAEVGAADPAFFRTEQSREILFQSLTSAEEIDATFVSFEDGYHRAVTRIDDNRRRSDPKIPQNANWHMNFMDDFSAGEKRSRHRTFYDIWDHVVGTYDVPTTTDYRTTSGYPEAKQSGTLAVTEPQVNVDTGFPIINLRVPIFHDGAFVGCAGASITLDVLSRFLAAHRASVHSKTIIADALNGKIIALSEKEKGVRLANGKIEVAGLENIDDGDVRQAYQLQRQKNEDDFLFRSTPDGEEISASFTRFPGSFGRPWEIINLTPTDDFVGTLKRTNRQMIVLIATLTAIELLLIYFFSRRLSRPIESVSRELRSVEDLTFSHAAPPSSKIKEIKELQTALSLFETSLRSFSSFVPLGVVRELIKTGIPLTLGVESRFMTVLFADLQDFSSLAEQIAPNDLLAQLSVYFEAVSQAIAEEHGTVDKFIGDGIMAFWGAPTHSDDHVLRGCCGMLRAARRMQQLNADWKAQGRPPLRLRVGLHCADVLVGNVGSSERLSYTVMGDGVNVAARLEGINKTFGTTLCISDSVVESVGPDIVARPIRKVQVKGRNHKFMIYELMGIRTSDDPELAPPDGFEKLCEMTRAASSCFERGDLHEAARLYENILMVFPHDPLARSLLSMCSATSAA
ncbi:adenylate/guanylate cyclase domain-containing protein [Bradyrhizobium macuxiense]|uniref:adenylate/guanylate cyclase domain-containing protein n=1 Tax=Bradyrhizobium macuxiense TaxID=1755647 RepID=UPI001FD96DE5|nr:adenylate/guanylate cyclase domain-containing protein [Bradyrhizobium macuxiense]